MVPGCRRGQAEVVLTLVSACVLACDLVQHPAGLRIADTVDRVLVLGPYDLDRLAVAGAPAPGRADDRAVVLAAAEAAPRLDRLVTGVRGALAEAAPSPVEARTMVDALAEVLVGRLEQVLALLLQEGPLAHPRLPSDGVQAALDAVAAAWLPAGSSPAVLAAADRLSGPWRVAAPTGPVPLDTSAYGPGGAVALDDLLDRVSRLDHLGWRRVVAARAAGRRGLRWSTALHVACRAAAESGRVLPVARAQLAAARTMRLAGVSASADARAAAMIVTAAVQATCLRGLLPDDVATTLLEPWAAA